MGNYMLVCFLFQAGLCSWQSILTISSSGQSKALSLFFLGASINQIPTDFSGAEKTNRNSFCANSPGFGSELSLLDLAPRPLCRLSGVTEIIRFWASQGQTADLKILNHDGTRYWMKAGETCCEKKPHNLRNRTSLWYTAAQQLSNVEQLSELWYPWSPWESWRHTVFWTNRISFSRPINRNLCMHKFT